MYRFSLSLLAMLMFSAAAAADGAAPFIGKWSGQFQLKGEGSRDIELVITDQGGTYKAYARKHVDQKNPCLGRDFPVTLQQKSSTTLVVVVNAADAISGCVNLELTLNLVDSTHLEGSLRNGNPVFLERK